MSPSDGDSHPEEEEEDEPGVITGNHKIYTTKYGSEVLQGMRTMVSNSRINDKGPKLKIEALADQDSR